MWHNFRSFNSGILGSTRECPKETIRWVSYLCGGMPSRKWVGFLSGSVIDWGIYSALLLSIGYNEFCSKYIYLFAFFRLFRDWFPPLVTLFSYNTRPRLTISQNKSTSYPACIAALAKQHVNTHTSPFPLNNPHICISLYIPGSRATLSDHWTSL